MPAGSPRRRRSPVVLRLGSRTGRRRSPGLPSAVAPRRLPRPASRRARHPGVLTRTYSAPALLTMPSTSDGNGGRDGDDDDDDPPETLQILPRHHTCADIRSPTLALSVSPQRSMEGGVSSGDRRWEGKVLVTVAVEGSPGPVRAMVKLGASVEEAIGAVVDAYRREGRSPRLDPAAISSFQLHHNHFCLESLDKKETLGQVGGRNFYLRRNRGIGGGAGAGDAAAAPRSQHGEPLVALSTHPFLCVAATRLGKMGRRLGKLWRAFGCATCG